MSKALNTGPEKAATNGTDGLPSEVLDWPESERELIREVVEAVRTIRFGSIVLTIHNGQVVEVTKNIRFRPGKRSENE